VRTVAPANNSISVDFLYGDQSMHDTITVLLEFKNYGSGGKKVELSVNGKKYRSYDFIV